MEYFDLLDIGEADIEILSPVTAEKLIRIGEYLKLKSTHKVIDFGCGKAELLALWGRVFGLTGVGVDIRKSCYDKAVQKILKRGLVAKISIIQGKAVEIDFPPNIYDVAVCVAASYVWGGFRETLIGLKKAIKPAGKLVIGEPYWINKKIDSYYCSKEPFYSEHELLQICQEEGFDFEFMFRAGRDDIDRYESTLWRGFINWIEANPDHPERQQIIDHLHKIQKEYLEFDRDNLGWAIYVLNPVKYKTNAIENKQKLVSADSTA